MWELFTYGARPYGAMMNDLVVIRIEKGEMLEKPTACPQAAYLLLSRCWNLDARKRPSFGMLRKELMKLQLEARQRSGGRDARCIGELLRGGSNSAPAPVSCCGWRAGSQASGLVTLLLLIWLATSTHPPSAGRCNVVAIISD